MKRQLNISRLITILLALALAVIMAVGSTFSWYDRTPATVNKTDIKTMNYSVTGKVNAPRTAQMKTYLGVEDNGEFTYNNEVSGSVLFEKGENIKYFKTDIDITDNGDALVSLYLQGLTYTKLGQNFSIGVINPEKTLKSYTADSANDVFIKNYACICDNILIPTDTDDDGQEFDSDFTVYWYIKFESPNESDESCTLSLGKMHLLYN